MIKEMISGKKNVKSGLLGQFLKDAQKGKVPPGTVLVVETWSRLSRGDMADCMQLMLDIFNAGLGVSFCDWGCQILRSFDETGGTVFQIVGAAQRSHGEWHEKQARTVGARQWRRNEIAANASGGKSAIFGNYRFKPRSECPDKPGYPRWLDVAPNGDWILLEEEIAWVQRAFKLAMQMGTARVARELRAMGVTQAESNEPITKGDLDAILRSVTVLGWRQNTSNNKPVGEPDKGVYPAIITLKEFEDVQIALRSRNKKDTPNGRHRHNLFEKRTYCGSCGSLLGVRNARDGHAFTCSGKKKDGCDVPNIGYDENFLLGVMTQFRWSNFFGNENHDAELANARRIVLALTSELGALGDKVESRKEQIKGADKYTPLPVLVLWGEALKAEEADYNSKNQELLRAQANIQSLERRPTGRAAEHEVRKRIRDFMEGDRTDISLRDEFNNWLFREDLGFVIDTRIGSALFGRLEIGPDRKVTCIDSAVDDAAALGATPEQLKELQNQLANRDASVKQQLQEAAEAKAKKERNRTPESEAERLAGLEKFKQQIEAHIERRDAERAANPESSEWPQPEKAWPHVDRHALKRVIVQRQTEARAHQSKRPKTLSQQQAQQQQ